MLILVSNHTTVILLSKQLGVKFIGLASFSLVSVTIKLNTAALLKFSFPVFVLFRLLS